MIRLRKGLASRIWENLVRPHAAGRRSVPLALLTRSAKWPIVVRARYGAAMQVLAMIGEQFEASDEICGAVLSVRQHEDIVALWTRTAADGLGILAIRCEPHARLPRPAPPLACVRGPAPGPAAERWCRLAALLASARVVTVSPQGYPQGRAEPAAQHQP